jgi:hypothetical protein
LGLFRESSSGEEFVYARVFSAKIPDGLDRSLDELEDIAREGGTEEIIMFLQSDGPEVQADRWIIRLGSEKHAYPPGFTVKARTHLRKQKQMGVLKVSEHGRKAVEVLAERNARLQWVLPKSVRSPLLCDIYENNKLLAVNTIHEKLSPSGKQQWPEVIRIDLPQRDWSIIQVFEYLDEEPDGLSDGLSSVQKKPPQPPEPRWRLPVDDTAVAKLFHPEDTEPVGESSNGSATIEKIEPVLFSTPPPVKWDKNSGWQPGGSPLQVRLKMGVSAPRISSSIWGDFLLTCQQGSDVGALRMKTNSAGGNVEMDFGVEVSVEGRVGVDLGFRDLDFKFSIPYTPNFDLRCYDAASFDSYFPDSTVHLEDIVYPQELYSVTLAGVKGKAEIKAGASAEVSVSADMEADSITTESDLGEIHVFTLSDPCHDVNLGEGGSYYATATYDENLTMTVNLTFYPWICAEVDTWFYDWDYCVSTFSISRDVYKNESIDLDLECDLEFEETYDLVIVASDGGTTWPEPNTYTWYDTNDANNTWYDTNDPNATVVIASVVDDNYLFDYLQVDGNVSDQNYCNLTWDSNNYFHAVYAAFYRAKATAPFPANGAEKVSNDVVLSWTAGERAASHDVYFGTDYNDVNNAGDSDPCFYRGNQPLADVNYIPPEELERCKTYYWRVDEVNDPCVWTGKVWYFTVAGCCASAPRPRDGAPDEPCDVVLSWRKGACVAEANGHHVYFGTDYNEVNDANMSDPAFRFVWDQNTCNIPEYPNNLPTTYYWRVDEANDAYTGPVQTPWKGPVWEFRANHIVVDNFEDYNDANLIYGTWKGWWVNDTGAEIRLGVDPNDPVHSGKQSMVYDYDNTTNWGAGFYSEIEANTADLQVDSNWTAAGVKALVLYYWGDYDTEQMYVLLEDAYGFPSGVVECDNDANDPNEFNVDLQDPNFNSVDMNNIAKIYIGFGDRGSLEQGGSDTVYFDDIRLYPPRCRPQWAALQGDISNRDCVVNNEDLGVMARDWLMSDYAVMAEDPNANLLVEYTFTGEANFSDTSGNGRDGDPCGNPIVSGGVLTLDGNDFVDIGGGFNQIKPFDGNSSFSIAIEFRTKKPGTLISSARDNNLHNRSMALFVVQEAVLYGNFAVGTAGASGDPLDDGWHHVAVTYDANSKLHHVYLDGGAGWDNEFDPNIPDANQDTIRIGGSQNPNFPEVKAVGDFDGDINSVEIYDYALSPNEVCYLVNLAKGYSDLLAYKPCYQPLKSPANLYPKDPVLSIDPNLGVGAFDPNNEDIVNFKDYAKLANNWLKTLLWPEEE